MREIPLTRGKVAIVDDEDYEWLNQWKWRIGARVYAVRQIYLAGTRKEIFMHRFIMNTPPDLVTDHINFDTLDNRRSNLRICTKQQNTWKRKPQARNSLGKYKGVIWDKRWEKWLVRIGYNGKVLHLGTFISETEAAKAYNEAALRLHGEFAIINIIEESK